MMEISERMLWMLQNQGKWAEEYRLQQAKYKLEKGRREKARVKEKKALDLTTHHK